MPVGFRAIMVPNTPDEAEIYLFQRDYGFFEQEVSSARRHGVVSEN